MPASAGSAAASDSRRPSSANAGALARPIASAIVDTVNDSPSA
jgi:hypothetical protein